MTPEGRIKNAIFSWLKIHRALVFTHDSVGIYDPKINRFRMNMSPHRRKGVSDILGIWEKRFLAIEVKVPGKYATKEQKEFLADVEAHGGIAFVARSIDDVEARLKPKSVSYTT